MSGGLEASRRRPRRNVVLTAAIAGLAGLLFGYDTGIIAGGLLFIKGDFALGSFAQGLVASGAFWFGDFALGSFAQGLVASGAFWFYGAIGILTLVFRWKLVPETKGKRLEDIQAYFQSRVDRHASS
jgi:hypothetical protein